MGDTVGILVGTEVGTSVGTTVGDTLGSAEGCIEGELSNVMLCSAANTVVSCGVYIRRETLLFSQSTSMAP